MGRGSRVASATEQAGSSLRPTQPHASEATLTTAAAVVETSEQPEVITFAFPGPLRDKLVAAILSGKKTATSALAIEWEVEGADLPAVGQLRTVVDSDEQPVGVIETTSVEVIRLGDADLSLAHDEGEDFEDVAQWRADHERFWNDEVIPTLPAGALAGLTDDTQILVTRFRLATTNSCARRTSVHAERNTSS